MALNALTKLGPNSLPPKLSVDELNVAGITTSGSAVVTGVTTSGAFHGDLVGSVSGGNIAANDTDTNEIRQITIASTGDATDWGDLAAAIEHLAGTSNAHGGLS